jgi:peptidoglycan/LPS O-acetylase OafA/YrhL
MIGRMSAGDGATSAVDRDKIDKVDCVAAADAALLTENRPEGRFYRPELDALRFFAFFSVFLAHALQPSPAQKFENIVRGAGSFGLSLFFLLSAFLITELLLRERSRTGTVHLRAFYARRILRIWPLYFAIVGFGYLFGLVRPDAPWGFSRLVAYFLLLGNFYTGRHGQAQNQAGAMWSISIEEQFYLLWPSIVKRGTRLLLFVSSLLVPLAYFWIFVLLRTHTTLEPGIWTNSIVEFQFFGLGALIALALRGKPPKLHGGIRLAMFLAGVALWLLASGYFDVFSSQEIPVWRVMMGYASVALGCGLQCLGILGARPKWFPGVLVYLGKISYGLYAFHLLGLRMAYALAVHMHRLPYLASALMDLRIPVALGITVLVAMLSYQFFETPFLRIKERFTLVKSRAI